MQITKLDTLAGIAVKYNVSVCSFATLFGRKASSFLGSSDTGGLHSKHVRMCQVADIKRANGLLSDTAMFAKEYLLIPSKSMCVG